MSRRRIHLPFSTLLEHEVFAVDERSAQLIVRSHDDFVRLHLDGSSVEATTTAGAAVVDVGGLEPDRSYSAQLEDSKGAPLGSIEFRTKPSIGPILSRFATISDLHLGSAAFGPSQSFGDAPGDEPYAFRCALAAIEELEAWGAEVLVVKGDLTDKGSRSDWELARKLFAATNIPTMLTPGNHDQWKTRELEPDEGARMLDLDDAAVQTLDLDPIRLVLGDTSLPNRGMGNLAQIKEPILDAAAVDRPLFVGLHHNLQRLPITWFWPAGITSTNARPVLNDLVATNPRLLISSGHTHRNRVHHLGHGDGAIYTEVSATSDYPGVWAGYEVSETTIRQTVRRIASPTAVGWTEQTRDALRGIWPRWSQGRLHDRCVDVDIRD